MNETRLSYGSSATRQPRGGPQANGSARNPSNPRDAAASNAANDWATKKREQAERAKLLREERKHGSSHLKSAGGAQMTPSYGGENAGGASGMDGYNSYQPH